MTQPLPNDILQNILSHLDVHTLAIASCVSKKFQFIAEKVARTRVHKAVRRALQQNADVVAGHAVYCINDVTGEISNQSLLSKDSCLSHEESQYLAKCFYDTEINLKAKLRGLKLAAFPEYFTVVKEDSFLSKKPRRGIDERILDKNADFEDLSPPKEVLSFISLLAQRRQMPGDNEPPAVRQSYIMSQCGNIFVITRCTKRHAMRHLNSITCNLAETIW